MNVRLTDTQRCEIVDRYQAGESVAVLAGAYDTRRLTVHRILACVEKRPQSDGPNLEVGRLYAEGLSGAEIGERTGVKRGSQWSHRVWAGCRFSSPIEHIDTPSPMVLSAMGCSNN